MDYKKRAEGAKSEIGQIILPMQSCSVNKMNGKEKLQLCTGGFEGRF